jgi:hypothetical protein
MRGIPTPNRLRKQGNLESNEDRFLYLTFRYPKSANLSFEILLESHSSSTVKADCSEPILTTQGKAGKAASPRSVFYAFWSFLHIKSPDIRSKERCRDLGFEICQRILHPSELSLEDTESEGLCPCNPRVA